MEQDLRAAIENGNRKFMEALRYRDAAGVAACYTQRGRILPPGGEMMQGRANIQSFWQSVIDSGVSEAQLHTLELEAGSEELVREIGQFRLTIQQNGETVYSPGKYVVVWKREEGQWKMDVDIWNS